MSSSATYQLISTLSSSGSSSVPICLGSVNTINTQIAALSSHQSGQSPIPGTPQHSSPWDHKWTSCHHHICTRQEESGGLVTVVSPLLLPVAHGLQFMALLVSLKVSPVPRPITVTGSAPCNYSTKPTSTSHLLWHSFIYELSPRESTSRVSTCHFLGDFSSFS